MVAHWVRQFVAGHGLCPWAQPALRSGSLAMASLDASSEEELLEGLLRHAKLLAEVCTTSSAEAEPALDANDECEVIAAATTIVVAPGCAHFLSDFEDFCWIGDVFEQRLQGVEQLHKAIQLVSFHPHFCIARTSDGVDGGKVSMEDAADFVNRSPFPAFHLLRRMEVRAAIGGFAQKLAAERQVDEVSADDASAAIAARNRDFLRTRGLPKCRAEMLSLSSSLKPRRARRGRR